jgi:hypothetical protein
MPVALVRRHAPNWLMAPTCRVLQLPPVQVLHSDSCPTALSKLQLPTAVSA